MANMKVLTIGEIMESIEKLKELKSQMVELKELKPSKPGPKMDIWENEEFELRKEINDLADREVIARESEYR